MDFNFNQFSIEIDNIIYNDTCEKIICNHFREWINSKKYTTFPTKKNKWLNIFKTHNNIYTIEIKLSIEEVIDNLEKNKIPYTYRHIYKQVKDFMESKKNFDIELYKPILEYHCIHIDIKSPEFILEALIKYNYLIKITEDNYEIDFNLLENHVLSCGTKRKSL